MKKCGEKNDRKHTEKSPLKRRITVLKIKRIGLLTVFKPDEYQHRRHDAQDKEKQTDQHNITLPCCSTVRIES
jgi:hypothetical protein